MTDDLPTLKIGCGILWDDGKQDDLIECVPSYLCPTCKHNLDAVKAHAAAHHKEIEAYKSFDDEFGVKLAKKARDAVLALAGKTMKDLEGKKK